MESISLIPVGSTCEEQVLMKIIQDNESKISQLEKEKIVLSAQLDATSHALQVAKREKQVLQHSLLMNRHKKNKLQSECTVLKSHKLTMAVIKTNMVWIQYYTAFENLEALNAFMSFVIPDHSVHPISSKNKNTSKLSVADELLLVLVKLRHGFENTDLAFRFNIHTKLVAKIFKEWINYLYSRLGALNIWPHRDIILNHAPDRFQKNFPLTIIILDGTEFKIEKPSSLVCQSQTYSNYKSSNTLKGLVGVDPRGGIIFISQLYSGAISDKEITKQSGFYEVLKNKLNEGEILPGDNVMADKGFNIQKEIEDCGLTLNIPPFARSQQFTEEEVLLTRKIASCRVNVERAIRRIKSFKLLKKQIPLTLLPLINQVWTVCCVLSNFRCSTR